MADCPKCGEVNAFRSTRTMYGTELGGKPTYHERNIIRDRPGKDYADSYWEEYLAWPCRTCGYEYETPIWEKP